ncbi:hypothetical protein ACFPM7_28900 [Actinokineospora guangxiensis]|uniref:Subtilisin inhibitor-like n=1 Tax=Actinokineospora guangxiensis TaxID=1490288 RepID=A0ABW0EXK5_9PSEU
MQGRRSLVLIPVAAACALLAACGQTPAAQSPTTTTGPPPTTAVTTSATTSAAATTTTTTESGGGVEPVDCGEIKVNPSSTHHLIAQPTAGGRVGCTEAFTVIDEYLNLPPDKKAEGSLGNVDVSNGWSCTTDDGETAAISCVKGEGDQEFAFTTTP